MANIIMHMLKIALVSPSGTYDYSLLEESLAAAENYPIEIAQVSEPRLGKPFFINGSKQQRLEELHRSDKAKIDAVWCARGGCGALDLWHDYQDIPKVGVPLIGYSDATIVHFMRFYHSQRIGIHGPIFFDLRDAGRANFEQIRLLIDKKAESLIYPPLKLLNNSLFDCLSGELLAMNLISLQSLVGSFKPEFLQRKILALEEVNEPLYKVYRALMQLKNAGCLFGLKALVIGQFNQDRKEIIEQILVPLADELGIPLFDWPIFGHEKPNWPLLFGAKASIHRLDDRIFTLKYHEQHDHEPID